MKNLPPTVLYPLTLVVGVLLFILTYSLTSRAPRAAVASKAERSDAPPAVKPWDSAPFKADTAKSDADKAAADSAADDESADADDAAPDTAASSDDDDPPRRGFTNLQKPDADPPPRRGFTTSVASDAPRRGFTSAVSSRPRGERQNPFSGHGPAGHYSSCETATDHVGAEIFDALEDRPVLAIWLFDRTESSMNTLDRVAKRFETVYGKLNALQAERQADAAEPDAPPLVSVVGAFGKSVEFLTPEPTADTTQLSQAIASIRDDGSSEERPLEAIGEAVKKFGKYRTSENRTLLVVLVTDEAGDDGDRLDELVPRLSKAAIPVYVIGVPAPFGLATSLSGTVQSESGKPVRQGPESLMSEVIDMGSWTGAMPVLDSGFGPFALSRLAVETGGQYMAVRLIAAYDPQQMARHAPDYVTRAAYEKMLGSNQACRALVEAAKLPHVDLVGRFDTQFPKQDEATMKRTLDKAQQASARLEPKVAPFYRAIAAGESDRAKLTSPRWQAGFDLAMGRAAAARSRIEGYNASLAQLKAGKSFPDPSHTTWLLRPTNDVKGDSGLEKLAGQARKYLNRVVAEHPDTPWANIATRELAAPLGWELLSR